MATARPQISTTVRFGIQLAEKLAPDWTEAKAFAAWGKPQRSRAKWGEELTTARRFHLEAASRDLAAWEWNAQGPRGTALLVHGWSGNASQLGSFVLPLVERGFHVVSVDLPAHGETAGNFATVPLFADVVAGLLHRLRPSVLIAHSLGATGSALAMRHGPAPSRVALLAPPTQLPPYLRHFTDFVGLSEAMHGRLLKRVEAIVQGPVETLDLRRHAPGWGNVASLLVHDVSDVVVPVTSSRELRAVWPGAQLVETEGLSHDRIRRDRDVVARVVSFVTGQRMVNAPEAVGELVPA
ncbi:MAG TPA: alpha/beta fold hydrolase [Archangium sp.]